MVERGISQAEAYYIIDYGSMLYRSGAVWFVLCRRDIPLQDRYRKSIARLVGIVVCVEHGVVTTLFRNPDPLRYINRKEPHYRPGRKSSVVYLWEVAGKAA